jgi:uncharacterized integral membrane protein (TIGR00698 family)
LLVKLIALPPAWAGLFIGGSIHDVAQVVGAGYLLGPQVGDTATIVKLFRVSMLALVVIVVSAAYRGRHGVNEGAPAAARRAWVPWFLWVFIALVGLHSLHAIPDVAQPGLAEASRTCLIVAIAALGVKTSFQMLCRTGWRPFVLLLAETVWLALLLLTSILMLRPG